jgi:hypothetical protein
MEILRDSIWDFLYQAGEPRSVEDIVNFVGSDRETVLAAVEHEWFSVNGGEIEIAYSIPAD